MHMEKWGKRGGVVTILYITPIEKYCSDSISRQSYSAEKTPLKKTTHSTVTFLENKIDSWIAKSDKGCHLNTYLSGNLGGKCLPGHPRWMSSPPNTKTKQSWQTKSQLRPSAFTCLVFFLVCFFKFSFFLFLRGAVKRVWRWRCDCVCGVTTGSCPERLLGEERRRTCPRPCKADRDCGNKRQCLCDGQCGLSCVAPGNHLGACVFVCVCVYVCPW